MPRCTHKGCGKEYDEATNTDTSCSYHPGVPVFHEGLKSWSCCKEVNKPVMEFDQFMSLPGCTTGKHTDVAPVSTSAPAAAKAEAPSNVAGGVETYGTGAAPAAPTPSHAAPAAVAAVAAEAPIHPPTPAPAPEYEEEEDDPIIPVPDGATCKHLGCNAVWKGEAISRGDGPEAKCIYHPRGPVFHEGSKGYLCCKRRVLEFSEFMNIPGCKEGKHLFVGSKKDDGREELVQCRIDHYQTPMQVHVSAYAKNCDKEKSKVTFGPQSLDLDLYLPGNKRVIKSMTLYGPIDPAASTYRILGSKVDITLQKPHAASWPVLELPAPGTELPPGYGLTFGVSARTGTVGGKEMVLSAEEAAKQDQLAKAKADGAAN